MNFQGREIFEGFSIDRLSQMTPILDNSLFSQKDKLSGMIKRGHMNVCTFYLKHSQSNIFFNFLPCRLKYPHQMSNF